jgi:cytidylate kinase
MAVITISRQYGSLGDEIAARVCESLGYRSFDKRLMAAIASEVGLSDTQVVDFSEDSHEVRGFLDRLLGRGRGSSRQVRVWSEDKEGTRSSQAMALDDAQAIGMVQTTIEAAYAQGNMVVVGRGGQALLADKPDVLHVRVEASFDNRVRTVQRQENLSLIEAEELVERRDRASADYLQRFYGIDGGASSLYHLVINTDKCGVEAAAQIMVHALDYLKPLAVPEAEAVAAPE